jgi:hypothetical protein
MRVIGAHPALLEVVRPSKDREGRLIRTHEAKHHRSKVA